MEIDIRRARASDSTQLVSLLHQLGYPTTNSSVEARLRELMDRSDYRVVVAADQEAVVGVACVHVMDVLHRDQPVAFITALVVGREARGRGIGRKLLQELESFARKQNCGRLLLTSSDHRKDAHSFYQHLGFESSGRRFAKDLS